MCREKNNSVTNYPLLSGKYGFKIRCFTIIVGRKDAPYERSILGTSQGIGQITFGYICRSNIRCYPSSSISLSRLQILINLTDDEDNVLAKTGSITSRSSWSSEALSWYVPYALCWANPRFDSSTERRQQCDRT